MRNDYQERQENRRAAYEKLAEKNESEGAARFEQGRKMASIIPFGQPILVGHHSEKSDRNYRERIANNYRKGSEALSKAKHFAEKAETVGTGGVSSDDPDAVDKLREKLQGMREFQEQVKSDNAKLRKAKISPDDPQMREKLLSLGISEWSIGELATLARVCRYHVTPYLKIPSYKLSNNNANLKRLEKRIAEIERLPDVDAGPELLGQHRNGQQFGKCEALPEIGRIAFTFPGKPSDEVRRTLKQHGFRWSSREGAWLRHLHTSRGVAIQIMHRWHWVPSITTAAEFEPFVAASFGTTCIGFQAQVREVAEKCGKSVLFVYSLWREYSDYCQCGDQSAVWPEFLEWYKDKLTA